MMIAMQGINANGRDFPSSRINETELEKWLMTHFDADYLHRADARKVLSPNMMKGDASLLWTDGVNVFCTLRSDDSNVIEMLDFAVDDKELYEACKGILAPLGTFIVKNKKMFLSSDRSKTVTIEQLGNYKMLVVRNSNGQPEKAYYSVTLDEMNNDYRYIFVQYLLMGNYTTPSGDHVLFGPKLPFYDGKEYDTDPGLFTYSIAPNMEAIYIRYGSGRVNHGDPSSPKYGKMPGGGGAAAIMGPMEWKLVPTVEGLKAWVTKDEPFVDHRPSIGTEALLTKVSGPYQHMHGKWTFASVVPLTAALLHIYPKQVLTLMRAEIYARHGDTFANPDTQRYFDAQPWYKPTATPVVLTPLERFNYNLIKNVELNVQ